MRSSKTTGFSSKLQNHLFDTFFLCQDLISSSSGLFTKSVSFEEKSKKDLRRSPDQFEREQTECDKLLLLAPLHFGERATCQRVRPAMRSRQGSNSSRMCFATTLGWETWKLFKNVLCIKTRLGNLATLQEARTSPFFLPWTLRKGMKFCRVIHALLLLKIWDGNCIQLFL